jgi:hypothetical protein
MPTLRSVPTLAVLLLAFSAAYAAETESVPPEEYPIYDLVIEKKFLTSQTELVLIDRLTVTNLGGEDWHQFFGGAIPADTLTDFLHKARRPARLESRFTLGVRYRFVTGDKIEEPEVFLPAIPVARPQSRGTRFDPTRIGVLRFSRVGFNRQENVALVYVGDHRPDGSGGGFLILLRRSGQAWQIVETEVLWVAEAPITHHGP